MAWKIDFTPKAEKQLAKVGDENAKRILKFLKEKVTEDPKSYGSFLKGKLREFWRYKIGDFRILVKFENEKFIVLVVKVEHRSKVYRDN